VIPFVASLYYLRAARLIASRAGGKSSLIVCIILCQLIISSIVKYCRLAYL
jgi:hypothetical protein